MKTSADPAEREFHRISREMTDWNQRHSAPRGLLFTVIPIRSRLARLEDEALPTGENFRSHPPQPQ